MKPARGLARRLGRAIWRSLCSLRHAVFIVLLLASALATATVLESTFDTATAQYWVYRTSWFYGILGALGVTIFCVAMDRFPWKRRQIPFLMAHLGILTLLAGSWMTDRVGVDGSLRVTEGETTSVVDFQKNVLVIGNSTRMNSIPVPWIPPNAEFEPISALDYGVPYDVKVDDYISHADATVGFKAVPEGEKATAAPAVKLKLKGGPMAIQQELWLWAGDPLWSQVNLGPARFSLGPDKDQRRDLNRLELLPQPDGSLKYSAYSPRGKTVSGKLLAGKIQGSVITPDWKGLTLTLEEWVEKAQPNTTYADSRIQYGETAPPSAIRVSASQLGQSTSLWLGLGDRAVVHFDGREVEVGYYSQRLMLPFSVRLEQFTVEHYEGTRDPREYASKVSVVGRDGASFEKLISMNEPLHHQGYTLYQASFEDAKPRPVTSILSVNKDPGRPWKYGGSLLIVLGSILLFVSKYRRSKAVAEAVKL